jgi:hypothetical protein
MSSLDYMTALHQLVRQLLQAALGLTDENFFRPHGMRTPAGAASQPYATVQIYASDMASFDLRRFLVTDPNVADVVPVGTSTNLIEVLETLDFFTASVQFWRDGAVDSAGRPTWGETAHSRARSLVARLELSENVALANSYGLGYSKASQVRDLSGNVDGANERRAQVDLTFYVSNAEVAAINSFRYANLQLKIQQPDGHLNEVNT